jgi:SAM-dependent methyltransferase
MVIGRRAIRAVRSLVGRSAPPEGVPPERAAGYYDEMYADDEAKYQTPYYLCKYYFLWTVIADRLRRAGVRRVLDIGCGPGRLATLLLEQGVEQYIGVDFSPVAVEMAGRNVPDPRARFLAGDARDPAIYRDNPHEVLICTEVLEHVDADLEVVAAFIPGRRCICSVPNFPYPSHVRHFADAAEVAARYGSFFDDFDVLTLKGPHRTPDKYFLMDGIRRG